MGASGSSCTFVLGANRCTSLVVHVTIRKCKVMHTVHVYLLVKVQYTYYCGGTFFGVDSCRRKYAVLLAVALFIISRFRWADASNEGLGKWNASLCVCGLNFCDHLVDALVGQKHSF